MAFVGLPNSQKIKQLLEAVMERYKMPATDSSRLSLANMLIALRQESKVGVTEMEILKNIYQKGSYDVPIQLQAAESAVYLERSK